MTLTIVLAWPDRALWQNSRKYWTVRAGNASIARQEAKIITLAALDGQPFQWDGGTVFLTITGCQPNRRRRDRGNLQAALKASVDGIAAALAVDDRHFVLTTDWGEYAPPLGRVVVKITV